MTSEEEIENLYRNTEKIIYNDKRICQLLKLNPSDLLTINFNIYDSYRIFFFELYVICKKSKDTKNKEDLKFFYVLLDLFLTNSLKLFFCDNKTKFLLDNMQSIKHERKINLPFDIIFLDVDFIIPEDESRIIGITIQKENDQFGYMKNIKEYEKILEEGSDYTEEELKYLREKLKDFKNFKNINDLYEGDEAIDISFVINLQDEDRTEEGTGTQITNFMFNLSTGKILNNFDDRSTKKGIKIENAIKKITNFVNNFLLYMNEPRVVIYSKNDVDSNKRLKRGLIPIPSLLITKIEIGLQEYMEKIYLNKESHSKLGFAFWVRGHTRKFKSDYYINKKGEELWIKSHIKGEGLMPPQVFSVTKADDNQTL